MPVIETLGKFEHENEQYEINRCEFENGFPYVQAYKNGKPYGAQVVPRVELFLRYSNGEDPHFYDDLSKAAKADITSGTWAKTLQRMNKRKP